jgi:hypothetical protein
MDVQNVRIACIVTARNLPEPIKFTIPVKKITLIEVVESMACKLIDNLTPQIS